MAGRINIEHTNILEAKIEQIVYVFCSGKEGEYFQMSIEDIEF